MAKLARKLPLIAVIAAALCNVIGGGINILIVDIQNEVQGIGNLVPWAMLVGGSIALIIALVYSALSTAMPRAGGGYIYISRGLSPFTGFIAAFLKWSGSVIALGTVAYMDSIIAATAAAYAGLDKLAAFLGTPIGMIACSLSIIWLFWLVNYFGVLSYAKTVIILAALMFFGGAFIIYGGLTHTPQQFLSIVGNHLPNLNQSNSFLLFFQAIAILFWAFIGFTSISQSGGEIENPKKNLPRAFIGATILVTLYYFIYSYAFYHAVPWQYIVGKENLNVPGLIGNFFPPAFAFLITLFIFVALANDVPPMLYSKSRLFYSWAKDKIVPKFFEKLNKHKVPVNSLSIVAIVASLVAIESVLGGFFTEVNVVVISRFIIYILMSFALIKLKYRTPKIFKQITFMKNRTAQIVAAVISISFSFALLMSLVYLDYTTASAWWQKASIQAAIIMIIGGLIYWWYVRKMTAQGKDYKKIFERLPTE